MQGAAGGAAFVYGGSLLGKPPWAAAAASNPIVAENQQPGSPLFRLDAGRYNGAIGGYTNRASIDKGEPLSVKINSYAGPATTAVLEVFRLGYYGGAGGRLAYRSPAVPLENQGFVPEFDQFGYTSADSTWTESVNIPTAGFESGMYLIKIVADRPGQPNQAHIPFVVRDDARPRDVLVLLPTNTWQAYNSWPGKCLYVNPSYDPTPVTIAGAHTNGLSRAVKVSFDRQHNNAYDDLNWVLRTEFPLIYWLERQGYDVTYTEDVAFDAAPRQELKPAAQGGKTKALAVAGHAEYWTREMFDKVREARDAGTHIASFAANAAYWQVRYEDDRRTLVCFKTVQGVQADAADNGRDGVNDFGPGATARGGPNDPLGPGGAQGAGNDKPEFATTTFRDPGVAPGDPAGSPDSQPGARSFEGLGRVGPDRPENELWGVLYVGDHDIVSYPLQVPAGAGGGDEFGAHRAWRHTSVANGAGASIGNNIVGWEWDAIPQATSPVYSRYLASQPAGVKRLAETDVRALATGNPAAGSLGYLIDDGRNYSHGSPANPAQPPAGQGPHVHAVTYRAASGAMVFAAGTIQWSFGLGPHFDSVGVDGVGAERTYETPPVEDSVQPVIQQATLNILADMDVQPATPDDALVLDSEVAPPVEPPPVGPPTTGPPKVSPPDTTPPVLQIRGGQRPMRSGGVVQLRVRCPRDEAQGVLATLTLFAEIPRPPRRGKRRKPRRVKLDTRRADLAVGQSRVIAFRLSPAERRLVTKRGRVRVVVVARTSDRKGNVGVREVTFRLLARASRP